MIKSTSIKYWLISLLGKALGERDPEYNWDLFEGDIMGVEPGQKV